MEPTEERCEGVDLTRVRKLQSSRGAMERKTGSEAMFYTLSTQIATAHAQDTKQKIQFGHMCRLICVHKISELSQHTRRPHWFVNL